MRVSSLRYIWRRLLPLLAICVGCCLTMAARAESENTNCGEPPHPSQYAPQSGDVEGAQSLSLERVFKGEGKLEVNMCSGELRIERGHGDRLKLRIETGERPKLAVRAYIKTLEVADDHATISLEFPHQLHAVVVLEVPSSTELTSEINLGAGKLFFDVDAVKGNRELNLGAGEAHLGMTGDHDYATFEANVGMGSFHDHRPGGHSAHFVISRDYQGDGKGKLEVNVGAGSLDVDPAKEQTI